MATYRSMATANSSIFLLLLAITNLPTNSNAHSFLTYPKPFNQRYYTIECQDEQCTNACPDYDPREAQNTAERPAATYRRGQIITIKWARNNHHGGFMRLSIYPISSMMNKMTQRNFAFYFGCWEQEEIRCAPGETCGTDEHVFRRSVVVPRVIPDGVYILAYAWYGGLHFKKDFGKFPDYHSCAFIRIFGGELETAYQPFFDPGNPDAKIPGVCHSAADDSGLCPKTGCTGPSYFTVPVQFQNGRLPAVLSPQHYGGSTNNSEPTPAPTPISVPDPTTIVSATPSMSPSPLNQLPDFQTLPPPLEVPSQSARPAASPTPSPLGEIAPGLSTSPGPGPHLLDLGICVGDVCCPRSCGECGGKRCQFRPGGRASCCMGAILESGRLCGNYQAPCYFYRDVFSS